MTTGYFHYKKKGDRKQEQVLTVYYEITPSKGILKYSCSLWKQEIIPTDVCKIVGNKEVTVTKHVKDTWMRKSENANAKANFEKDFVTHKFKPFEQGNLKLDDIW